MYLDKFNIQSFHHLKNGLTLDLDKDAKSFIKTTNQESKDILSELKTKDVKASIGARIMRDSTETKKANDTSKRLGTVIYTLYSII